MLYLLELLLCSILFKFPICWNYYYVQYYLNVPSVGIIIMFNIIQMLYLWELLLCSILFKCSIYGNYYYFNIIQILYLLELLLFKYYLNVPSVGIIIMFNIIQMRYLLELLLCSILFKCPLCWNYYYLNVQKTFFLAAKNGGCVVDKSRRNWCPACRFQKCLQSSMDVTGEK